MNERDKELAVQAGFYLYDLTATHEIKTVETNSLDEWVTLQKFADLIRADEREACAKVVDHMASRCNDIRAAALESAAENIRARGQA